VQTGFNWPWAGFSYKLLATWYWTCRFNTSLNFLTSWVHINYRKPTPASRQHLITKWERATQPYLMKLKLKTHLSSAYIVGMKLRSSTMLVSPLEGYEWSSSKCCHFISCGQVFCTYFHTDEPTAGLYRPQLTRKIPLPPGTEPIICNFIYWTIAAPTA